MGLLFLILVAVSSTYDWRNMFSLCRVLKQAQLSHSGPLWLIWRTAVHREAAIVVLRSRKGSHADLVPLVEGSELLLQCSFGVVQRCQEDADRLRDVVASV